LILRHPQAGKDGDDETPTNKREMKINGKVRRWKRDPDRVEIPTKYGLYEYFTFTNNDYDRIVVPV
jgi:hypothetical protein